MGAPLYHPPHVNPGHDEYRNQRQRDDADKPRQVEQLGQHHHDHDRTGGRHQQAAELLLCHDQFGVQPADQHPRLGAGEERERQPPDVVERLNPEVVADHLPDPPGDVGGHQRQPRAQHGKADGQAGRQDHDPAIILDDAVVDELPQQQGSCGDGQRLHRGDYDEERHHADVRAEAGEHSAHRPRVDRGPPGIGIVIALPHPW